MKLPYGDQADLSDLDSLISGRDGMIGCSVRAVVLGEGVPPSLSDGGQEARRTHFLRKTDVPSEGEIHQGAKHQILDKLKATIFKA